MALTTSEVTRIKAELGYPLLSTSAEPYIGIAAIFDQVIRPYLLEGASTTCTTAVTAAASPTPVTLTIASATGFAAGNTVIIDVDERQESATVQSLSGASIVVLLSLAHSGTYPVTVEGGESIIREMLATLRSFTGPTGKIAKAAEQAGLKKVDEIEFFDASQRTGGTGSSVLDGILANQMYHRDELAQLLGCPNLRSKRKQAAQSISVY